MTNLEVVNELKETNKRMNVLIPTLKEYNKFYRGYDLSSDQYDLIENNLTLLDGINFDFSRLESLVKTNNKIIKALS